jgi:acyl CoA:acetate/3-ketoacid CoA transferase
MTAFSAQQLYISRNAFVLANALISTFVRTDAQDRPSIIKAGGFIYFLDGSYHGFSAHAEYEHSLGKTLSF